VAQVGDGRGAKLALGALDEEPVLLKEVEDSADVLQVSRPRVSMSSKKTGTKRRKNGRRTSFMRAWNITEALHNLKHDQELIEAICVWKAILAMSVALFRTC
jgi:hypothetical protein